MKVRRPYVLVQVILTSLVLAIPAWDNPGKHDSFRAASFVADGGSPMPPLPPRAAVTFIADGGSPMPPLPPRAAVTFIAEGGSPMPPLPPRFTSSSYVA